MYVFDWRVKWLATSKTKQLPRQLILKWTLLCRVLIAFRPGRKVMFVLKVVVQMVRRILKPGPIFTLAVARQKAKVFPAARIPLFHLPLLAILTYRARRFMPLWNRLKPGCQHYYRNKNCQGLKMVSVRLSRQQGRQHLNLNLTLCRSEPGRHRLNSLTRQRGVALCNLLRGSHPQTFSKSQNLTLR